MSALQLQWDLSQSVGSTLALTQGIIRAATTDNVQPLALLACERFGATLAICQATCRNIEFEVIKVQTPSKRVLKFLGATIGFSGDDSTSQLVRSQAGVQFIGLVAALVPSLSLYEAAAALAMMLKDSAFDGTFLPPVSHLRDLLGSLEHRCARLGFSDQVVGWQRLLDKTSGKSAREYPALAGIEVPNIYCVAKLVDAFRQLSRIGDVSSITVRILRGAAWLAASTKWCIGTPPSIYWDDGKALPEDSTSKIVLIICKDEEGRPHEEEITVYRNMETISEVIADAQHLQEAHNWIGMLTIECYGQMLMRALRPYDPLGVIDQVLPYLLKQVLALLRPSDAVADVVAGMSRHPWPKDYIVSDMMSRMLGSTESVALLDVPSGTTVMDLPFLKKSLDVLEDMCRCENCDKIPFAESSFIPCEKKGLVNAISTFALRVLVLSLFENPDEMLVVYSHLSVSGQHSMVANHIYQIMQTGRPINCSPDEVMVNAFLLLDQNRIIGHDWVIHSHKGQTVYPRLFETQDPYEHGYMTLRWAPGIICFAGETYAHGSGRAYSPTIQVNEKKEHEMVSIPRNLFPNERLIWKVTPGDRIIYIHVAKTESNVQRAPRKMLLGLASSLILRRCAHVAQSPLDEPDSLSRYATHLVNQNPPDMDKDPRIINVVPVDGNNGLRLFALAGYAPSHEMIASWAPSTGESYGPIVLRKDACMACCLAFARKIKSRVIIC